MIKTFRSMRIVLLQLFIFSAPFSLAYGKSLSSDLFDVSSYRLNNGIPVIAKKLEANDRFSIQLIVNVGLMDFACKDRQKPHVLEHMLFEGTQTFSGPELRARIYNKGGEWNGFTTDEYTHYTMHIHASYADIAIDTLFRMINEPKITQASMENAKRSVNAERGIPNSLITQLFNDKLSLADIGKARLYPGTNLNCDRKAPVKHITLSHMSTLLENYYVSGNMTLIVLGHFNHTTVKALLNNTFGSLKQENAPQRPPIVPTPIKSEKLVERQPLNQSEAHVQMYLRAVGGTSALRAEWELLNTYLAERLFEEIRSKRGIGYTPRSKFKTGENIGHVLAQVKTTDQWYPQVENLFKKTYQNIKTSGIPPRDIERLKQRLILEFEAKERTNLQIAQLYRHQRRQIMESGRMPNLVEQFQNITPDSLQQVIDSLPDEPLIGILRPPESHEVALRIGGIILISCLLAIPLFRILKKRRQTNQEAL